MQIWRYEPITTGTYLFWEQNVEVGHDPSAAVATAMRAARGSFLSRIMCLLHRKQVLEAPRPRLRRHRA